MTSSDPVYLLVHVPLTDDEAGYVSVATSARKGAAGPSAGAGGLPCTEQLRFG